MWGLPILGPRVRNVRKRRRQAYPYLGVLAQMLRVEYSTVSFVQIRVSGGFNVELQGALGPASGSNWWDDARKLL